MKTPDQIAAEIIARNYNHDGYPANRYEESGRTLALAEGDVDTDGIETMLITAIETDRAQRPTLAQDEFEQIIDAMGALVRGLDRGVEYVTLVDAEAAERLIRDKFGPALYDDWSD